MTLNLDHLRALVAAADPCEWSVHENRADRRFVDVCTAHGGIVVEGVTKADAALIAEGKEWLGPLCDEVERLTARQSELLALVASISQTVPLESEVSEALAQRGALLAEVGTLRAALTRANEGFEKYEREYYLATDRAEAAEKERDELRARLDRFMSSAEIQLRHPDCDCHQEIGDSPCIVHGLDEADRIAKGTNRE